MSVRLFRPGQRYGFGFAVPQGQGFGFSDTPDWRSSGSVPKPPQGMPEDGGRVYGYVAFNDPSDAAAGAGTQTAVPKAITDKASWKMWSRGWAQNKNPDKSVFAADEKFIRPTAGQRAGMVAGLPDPTAANRLNEQTSPGTRAMMGYGQMLRQPMMGLQQMPQVGMAPGMGGGFDPRLMSPNTPGQIGGGLGGMLRDTGGWLNRNAASIAQLGGLGLAGIGTIADLRERARQREIEEEERKRRNERHSAVGGAYADLFNRLGS